MVIAIIIQSNTLEDGIFLINTRFQNKIPGFKIELFGKKCDFLFLEHCSDCDCGVILG